MEQNYLDIEEVVDAAWVAAGHDRYALDTNPPTAAQAYDAAIVLSRALSIATRRADELLEEERAVQRKLGVWVD